MIKIISLLGKTDDIKFIEFELNKQRKILSKEHFIQRYGKEYF